MSQIEPEVEEEKPLDPVMENVRRKMIRLQIVSGLVMFVSLMAVFGAVVYKVTTGGRSEPAPAATPTPVPADAPLNLLAALPAGFTVTHVSLSGPQVLFYGTAADGGARAYVFDITTGRIAATIAVGE
ncbi:hypothetical protein NOF55_06360 [Rhizobiaceae bacterium BDR2-2]|uniref:Transmembrane protein n=1 Tax=Ectorhizobium quercum TaxID=2965071 RepID=A0AAE3MXE4_9HYPH|nr:hypothetical protein [Ectorhizobium quercum]MCX8996724.1 hypothetical protein [Ectorhizobium quercum]